MSQSRDAALDLAAARLTDLQQLHAQQLFDFDVETAELLAGLTGDALDVAEQQRLGEREVLLAAQQLAFNNLSAHCAANIAAALPEVRVDAATSLACDGVAAEASPVSDLVDVVIAQPSVNGQPFNITVRCTPDCVFVTDQGDVAASDLAGSSILRVYADGTTDTFAVPSVTPVSLNEPVPVYRVHGDEALTSYCVGMDSTVSVVVRAG